MSLPESAPATLAPVPAPVIDAKDAANGVVAALVAYLLWGFLPLLLHPLSEAGAVLVVAERTIYSLILLAIVLAITGKFGEVRAFLRDGRKVRVLALSSVLLAFNWLLYVYAVDANELLQASFGYFINPLVNIAIGMVFLGERQNRWQTVSIGIAVIAIGIQAAALGSVPYISLGLAISFGLYGYFRKTAMLGPATGLFAETLMIAPVAIAYIGYNLVTVGIGVHSDPTMLLLLILTGPATAVPLLLFAFAVQRLRLTTIGMFQYLAPSIQFLIAVFVFHEEMNATRLVSFALIWLSLVVFSWDSFRRRPRAVAA
ncbi:MAG: rarD [Devosia sp.]|uniref:EamA family transporter RarD n=1 Tax=Devosia sp. TaxID=1871048 RepID=UPI00261A89D8|nr:EamA family transporter RarD [Devosia sp.]MDB5585443.1 rarD [Devosia sp.]